MKRTGLLIITVLFSMGAFAEENMPPGAAAAMPASVSVTKSTDISPVDVVKLQSGEGTLKVGHYSQLPPFYFANDNSQPGFGYDIFMAVAKKAGIKNVSFIGFDSETDLSSKLRQGKIDVIANSWDLPGTRKQFLLTTPYYTKGGLSFLFFKQKGSFQTVEDIKNHNVGVFKYGYAAHYWLPAHGVPQNSIKAYTTLKDLMFALKDGSIDVAVVYYPLAQLAQQQLTDQLGATLVEPINDVYALRKQDSELQKILNQAIQSLATDGELDKIQAQYLAPANASPENTQT